MDKSHINRQFGLLSRLVVFFTILAFVLNLIILPSKAHAQSVPVFNLPVPGVMISMSDGFAPPIIRGLTLHADNPLRFDFIVDTGDDDLKGQAFEQEVTKLIKYFLASLTIPEDEFWVNLSPYEGDRIIPEGLGVTELGRDLLGQDYILKQLTASLMYPEEKLGNEFWKRVYSKAQELYGTTEIPIDTFNKVWIIPEEAVVYEYNGSAFVGKRHLKVMLEKDYVAMDFQQKSTATSRAPARDLATQHHNRAIEDGREKFDLHPSGTASLPSSIIKEIIIPELEKEVNEGSHFAPLRQIFNSMILATWYKKNLKKSLLGQVYVDQNKVKGVDVQDKEIKQKIYNQYLEAFKQGVYNYIKEDYVAMDFQQKSRPKSRLSSEAEHERNSAKEGASARDDESTQELIPRKYFSGGVSSSPVISVQNLEVQPLGGQPRSQQEAIVGPESSEGRNRRVTTDLVENVSPNTRELAMVTGEGISSSPINRFRRGIYEGNNPLTAADRKSALFLPERAEVELRTKTVEPNQFSILSQESPISLRGAFNYIHPRFQSINEYVRKVVFNPLTDANEIIRRQDAVSVMLSLINVKEGSFDPFAALENVYDAIHAFHILINRDFLGYLVRSSPGDKYSLSYQFYGDLNAAYDEINRAFDNGEISKESKERLRNKVEEVQEYLKSVDSFVETIEQFLKPVEETNDPLLKDLIWEVRDALKRVNPPSSAQLIEWATAENHEEMFAVLRRLPPLIESLRRIEVFMSFADAVNRDGFKPVTFDETKPDGFKKGWYPGENKEGQVANDSPDNLSKEVPIAVYAQNYMSEQSRALAQDLLIRLLGQSFGWVSAQEANLHIKDFLALIHRGPTDTENDISAFSGEALNFGFIGEKLTHRSIVYADNPGTSLSPEEQHVWLNMMTRLAREHDTRLIMSTHHEGFIEEHRDDSQFDFYHFEALVDGEEVVFTNQRKRGVDDDPAKPLKIVRHLGLQEGIVTRAQRFLEGKEKPIGGIPSKSLPMVEPDSESNRTRLKREARDFRLLFPTEDVLELVEKKLDKATSKPREDLDDVKTSLDKNEKESDKADDLPIDLAFLGLSDDKEFSNEARLDVRDAQGNLIVETKANVLLSMLKSTTADEGPYSIWERQKMFSELIERMDIDQLRGRLHALSVRIYENEDFNLLLEAILSSLREMDSVYLHQMSHYLEQILGRKGEYADKRIEIVKLILILDLAKVMKVQKWHAVEFTDQFELIVEEGINPAGERRRQVPISVRMDTNERVRLYTGSTKSGKTVSMKTLSWHVNAAMAVGRTPAAKVKTPRFGRIIFTDRPIDVHDEKINDMRREVGNLTRVFALTNTDGLVLGLFDEPGSTMPSKIQGGLANAITEEMLAQGHMAQVTTHHRGFVDRFLQQNGDSSSVYHLRTERKQGGTVRFRYVIEQGYTSSNSIAVARTLGLTRMAQLMEEEATRILPKDYPAPIGEAPGASSPVVTAETGRLKSNNTTHYGGIDFNSEWLDLQIKRDEKGIPLPIVQQPIENMNIQGFTPVIINVSPVSIPLLLGEVDQVEEKFQQQLSFAQ